MELEDTLSTVQAADVDRVVEVWEASVRATHQFLKESDVEYFKPFVRDEVQQSAELPCVRDRAGQVVGFLGVEKSKIEMLFVDPAWRGHGIGRRLIEYALHHLRATDVDVNEQNEQAVGFYLRMGFAVKSRSELDGMGKPYPLLHMRYEGALSKS